MADSSGNSLALTEKEPVEQHTQHRNHSLSYSRVDLQEIDYQDADLLGMLSLVLQCERGLTGSTAKMGYKQELKRNFSTLEVFGIAFSIISLLPSIASTLSYSVPAGPVGMVWVCRCFHINFQVRTDRNTGLVHPGRIHLPRRYRNG